MITWAGFTTWLKGVPREVWILVLAAIGIFVIRQDAEQDGRRKEQVAIQKRQEKTRREAEAQARTIIEEEKTHADDAQEAAANSGVAEPERSGSMSDAKRRYIFGRARPPGPTGGGSQS